MTNDPTSRLNTALQDRYHIERELGEGGMATVYLAEDLKHQRKVAIKVLKPELAAVIGGERFLAEIRTTANLQHPHILALFDSGEEAGFLYYVMPYVEGETLREKIDRERQLSVNEAVHIAAAMASALDYAHRRDIIHRDIKPANILLHDGEPVVADFGIALAVSNAGGGRLTETGLSLGTPFYMSPEQATADRELDARSDLYSLGCVAYEMLTGDPPHPGSSAQAVLTSLLTADPKPITEFRKSVPPHVEAAVHRALERLPADRFESAGDFGKAISDPTSAQATQIGTSAFASRGAAAGSAVPLWQRMIWPAVAVAMAGLAAWGWAGEEPKPVRRYALSMPLDAPPVTRLNRSIAVSPIGDHFIYLGQRDGETGLFRRKLDQLEVTQVASAIDAKFVVSPDGRGIAYIEGGSLRTVSVDGGASITLAGGVESVQLNSRLSWADDGYIYFGPNDWRGLARIPEAGGEVERLPEPANPRSVYFSVNVLPGGVRGIATLSPSRAGGETEFGILHLTEGTFEALGNGGSAQLLPGGYLIWVNLDGTVMASRFDEKALQLVGAPVPVLQEMRPLDFREADLSVARNGTLVYKRVISVDADVGLIAVSRDGVERPLMGDINTSLGFRLSPDGSRVTFEEPDGDSQDIWVLNLNSGARTRLTYGVTAYYPAWHPDGTRVAFYEVTEDGEYESFWKNANGTGSKDALITTPNNEIEVVFTPSGEQVVVREGDRAATDNSDLALYDVGASGPGQPITQTPANERSPAISPDGRYVAYVSDESGVDEIFVISLTDPAARFQISAQGGTEPVWSHSGQEIFYREGLVLVSAGVQTDPEFSMTGERTELFSVSEYQENSNHSVFQVFPGDQEFLFLSYVQDDEIVVVENWFTELEERLGGS